MNPYILFILAPNISPTQLEKVVELIHLLAFKVEDINSMDNLSLDIVNRLPRTCFKLRILGKSENQVLLEKALKSLTKDLEIDFSLQIEDINRTARKLICFDMDSTLIQTEVIDELAIHAGVGEQVKAITESAMRGEIDFKASFKKRVALLRGLDEAVMKEVLDKLPLSEGLDDLMFHLKKQGYKIAILSGGFTYFASHLQQKYGIDYMYANQLEIEAGKLTGRYVGEIVDGKYKLDKLIEIATKENIKLEQTIALGDGANDLPMIKVAGLGIAFHAKPKVQEQATHLINSVGIDGILYYLGIERPD